MDWVVGIVAVVLIVAAIMFLVILIVDFLQRRWIRYAVKTYISALKQVEIIRERGGMMYDEEN